MACRVMPRVARSLHREDERVPRAYLQMDKIAASQFAVDRQVEQRQFLAGYFCHQQANSNRPDIFQLEWVFLADQFALVPRNVAGFGFIR